MTIMSTMMMMMMTMMMMTMMMMMMMMMMMRKKRKKIKTTNNNLQQHIKHLILMFLSFLYSQRCTAILRKFLNDPSIPEPEKVLCTRWKENRYQRGAYGAFLPVQASGKEIEGIQRPVYSNRTRHGQKVRMHS